jgi:hypothetical protein
VKDGVNLPLGKDVIGHVMFDKRKFRMTRQTGDIVGASGNEVVQANNLVPLLKETVAEMASDEPGSPGNQDPHPGLPIPS